MGHCIFGVLEVLYGKLNIPKDGNSYVYKMYRQSSDHRFVETNCTCNFPLLETRGALLSIPARRVVNMFLHSVSQYQQWKRK